MIQSRSRTFFVVMRPMPSEPCGGGGGVNYRLMLAQKKYGLFEEVYFVFSDRLISMNTGEELKLLQGDMLFDVERMKAIFALLNCHFEFNDEDTFVFHDIHSFYIMREAIGHINRSIVVYHQQGSMYYEGLAYGASPDKYRKAELDNLTKYAIENAGIFAFPSIGGRMALIDTLADTEMWLKGKKEMILYNGCTPDIGNGVNEAIQDIQVYFDRIKGSIFISVAVLNEAKGVERLPAFFAEYNKIAENDDWLWVIIGDGIKSDVLSQGLIALEGHVLWIRERIPNELVLRLYKKADYYIMAHRFSIFDFATIEAMHMGCIPVLSDVGGNREMLQYNNGYLLDDEMNANLFYEWKRSIDIEYMKDLNQSVATEMFSEECMLKRYYDAVNSL